MTQEHFLLKAANPEIQERSFQKFLDAQREVQKIWPVVRSSNQVFLMHRSKLEAS